MCIERAPNKGLDTVIAGSSIIVGCRMSDVGCRMSDVGCRMSDVGIDYAQKMLLAFFVLKFDKVMRFFYRLP